MDLFPEALLDGYRTFPAQRLPTEQSRYRDLSVRGQAPATMVIGCCDSRVSPEVIFDAGPGELFVMRNIANLVPTYQPDSAAHGVSAALEFAVSVLKVKHIVVLGHAQCGGIRAFIDKAAPLSPGDFIGKWMAMFIKPGEVVEQREHESMQEFVTRIEKAAVFRSLENLMTFPFVRNRVERGELQLHGAYFGVAEGSLFVLDRDAKEFRKRVVTGRGGRTAIAPPCPPSSDRKSRAAARKSRTPGARRPARSSWWRRTTSRCSGTPPAHGSRRSRRSRRAASASARRSRSW